MLTRFGGMSKRVIINKNNVSEETMNISTLLQGLASFAWIGFIGVLVMIFVRASRNQPAKGLTSLVDYSSCCRRFC